MKREGTNERDALRKKIKVIQVYTVVAAFLIQGESIEIHVIKKFLPNSAIAC